MTMLLSRKTLFASLLSILIMPAAVAQKITPLISSSYLQEVKSDVILPAPAGTSVTRLLQTTNGIIALTPGKVFRYSKQKWMEEPVEGNWSNGIVDGKGKIWLTSIHTLKRIGDPGVLELPGQASNDTILSLLLDRNNNLLVGTTNGLYSYNGQWTVIPISQGKRVRSILEDHRGDIWVATNGGMLRYTLNHWVNLDNDIMAYGLRRNYFALAAGPNPGEVLFGGNAVLGCIAENGDHWINGGNDGLPYGPATTIRTIGKTIWLGTDRGAIRKDQQYHYFCGKRWLANDFINDLLPLDEHTVWIATPKGISQIQQVPMTLVQKAASFEERIRLRHRRHGLISESTLTRPGDLTSNLKVTNDNDGLWTAMYLAAECYRYAVTHEAEAKQNADSAFIALERLETITGIPGFPARSLCAADEDTGKGGEWHLTPDQKWKWKGDTSSDEIVGHMFAFPLYYDLVAEGAMKERVKNLVHRIMGHIVDHHFQLIDLDGKATRWAVWTPDSINYTDNWWYERGINSMQILAHLKAAWHVTGDQKFQQAYESLIHKHHYAENMLQQKMYGPFDLNHSDDELAFLPNYILMRYANDPQQHPIFIKSTTRSWKIEQPDRIPLWNIISSTALKKDCDLRIALEELQQIPMDLITWRMENSQRWDIPKDPLCDRFGKAQGIRPIPTPERGISKWNTNTYLYDSGNNGGAEDDGAFFLLPYWMGRYYGYFVEK